VKIHNPSRQPADQAADNPIPEKNGSLKIWIPIIVFLLTFAIRLLFILETMNIPAFRTPNPGMDIDLHWQAARLLLQGATTDRPYFELMLPSTPFHQYWLALCQLIFGESMLIHRLFNALLSSVSAVLIFLLIEKRVQNRQIAFVCSVIWAGLPSLIYFDSTLHKSALEILILVWLLYLILNPSQSAHSFIFLLKGFLMGSLLSILLLLQGNTFLYCLIIFSYLAIDNSLLKKERVQILVIAVPLFCVTLLGFQFRNTIWNNQYPWFLPQKGIHFRIGFHKGAHGAYHQVQGIRPWPYGHVFHARLYAETQTNRVMTPDETDRYFLNQGKDFIKDNPLETIRLMVTKFFLFFNNYEIKGIDDLYYLKKQTTLLALNPLGLGILVLLSGLGVIRLATRKQFRILFLLGGLLGCMLFGNILGFISWRYRLHNVVPLIIFAAYGIQHLYNYLGYLVKSETTLGSRLLRFSLATILPLVVCGLLAYQPVMEKHKKGFLNRASKNDKLSHRAEKLIKQLTDLESISPLNRGQKIKKALTLNKLHRHTESFRILEGIHAQQRYYPQATEKYLVYLLWLGKYDQATKMLRNVIDEKTVSKRQIENSLKGLEKRAYQVFIKPGIEI